MLRKLIFSPIQKLSLDQKPGSLIVIGGRAPSCLAPKVAI